MIRDRELRVESVPLSEIKPYDGNAKKHTNEQIDAIENSIKEFGFSNPIIAWHNEDGVPEIVAGHGRAIAAKRLGIDEVPVIYVDDLTDAQRRALSLADNQTTMMTGWDMEQLGYELDTLEDMFDMEDFGFDPLQMSDIRTETEVLPDALTPDELKEYENDADTTLKSFNVVICCLDARQKAFVAGLFGVETEDLKRMYRAEELM